MPTKPDNTQNIRAYMSTHDKNTGKTKPSEHKGSASKNQNTNINMVKEAASNESKQNHRQSKNNKENTLSLDNSQTIMTTSTKSTTPTSNPTKRDSSERSPLEGNPQKKQCDTSPTCYAEANPQQTQSTPSIETSKIHTQEHSINQDTDAEQEKIKQIENTEPDQNLMMQTILQELKSIKMTIHHLGEKVDQSFETLAKNTTENTELKKVITSQNNQISTLIDDNTTLKHKNKNLEKDIKELEDEMLRLKVDVMGIPESPYENYDQLRGKIAEIMMTVCEGTTDQAKWEMSTNIPITDCRRIGTYRRNHKRTVRITFLFMRHKNCLLSKKSNLPSGIYVDNAFTDTTKRIRAILRPILKLAKTQEEYKGRCKLEKDQLIIKGTRYNLENLNQLPESLAPYKTAQKSSANCLVFQGLHSPLSNFHTSPFNYNGHKYNTSEQFIQHTKALHFKDHKTANKILQSIDPYEAKLLSRNIENFDRESWKLVAKESCKPGIKTKFTQNKMLAEFLKTTRPLKLAESSFDTLWGTGLPLWNTHCTDQNHWKNQGLLGEILTEIRDELH